MTKEEMEKELRNVYLDGKVKIEKTEDNLYQIKISDEVYSDRLNIKELEVEIKGLVTGAKIATRIEVPTSAGILRADTSKDPGEPGICVTIQPTGCDFEIDTSYVSVYEDAEYMTSDNERPEDVVIMTYSDVYTEDYTKKDILRREDIEKALDISGAVAV